MPPYLPEGSLPSSPRAGSACATTAPSTAAALAWLSCYCLCLSVLGGGGRSSRTKRADGAGGGCGQCCCDVRSVDDASSYPTSARFEGSADAARKFSCSFERDVDTVRRRHRRCCRCVHRTHCDILATTDSLVWQHAFTNLIVTVDIEDAALIRNQEIAALFRFVCLLREAARLQALTNRIDEHRRHELLCRDARVTIWRLERMTE